MIKYYDTEDAYLKDIEYSGSRISMTEGSGEVRYDGRNVVVGINSAATGSIVLLDRNNAVHFVAADTYDEASMPEHQAIGVVVIGVDHEDYRGRIAIMSRDFKSLKMANIYIWRLTGYTLDGTDRTGTLSIHEETDTWSENIDHIIEYNAASEPELVTTLNAHFRNNEPFRSQDWVAVLNDDNTIDLHCAYVNWKQSSYNKGTNGFSISGVLEPKWEACSNMLRMNGKRSGSGAVINMERALMYFRNDNANTAYNPASEVKSINIQYPICLPGYLGTSQYQDDHCAYLRSVYGEGEEGWLKFMDSFLPVMPSPYGIMGMHNALNDTYRLASKIYVGQDGEEKAAFPAARHAAEIGYDNKLLAQGRWHLPDIDTLAGIVKILRYSSTPSRDADAINRALLAIGASALGNNSNVWSCSRYSADHAWYSNGSTGYVFSTFLYGSSLAVPLLLLDVPLGAS